MSENGGLAKKIMVLVSRPGWREAFAVLAAALITVVLYWLSLKLIFPGYYQPLLPANRDVVDHFAIGYFPWDVIMSGTRPAAWAEMKLLHPLGIEALSLFEVFATCTGILLIAFTVRELGELNWSTFFASLPIYLIALFCHPEFYIKHRDDFELDASFLYLSIALFSWLRWSKSGSGIFLTCFAFASFAFPFAKETFFATGPVLFAGFAIARGMRKKDLFAAGYVCACVVIAYFVLKERSSFLTSSANEYATSFDPKSMLGLFWRYMLVCYTFPSLMLCLYGLWVARKMKVRLQALLIVVLGGVFAYLPNSSLPNHWIEWYGWDGLPLLLIPLISVVPIDLAIMKAHGVEHGGRGLVSAAD